MMNLTVTLLLVLQDTEKNARVQDKKKKAIPFHTRVKSRNQFLHSSLNRVIRDVIKVYKM